MREKQETVETLNSRTVDWIFNLKQDRERLVLARDLIQDCLRLLRAQQEHIAELESELKHLRRFRANIAKINEENGDE